MRDLSDSAFRHVLSDCVGGDIHRLVDRYERNFFLVTLSGNNHVLSSRQHGLNNRRRSSFSLLHHSHFSDEILGYLRSHNQENSGSHDGN